MKLYQSPTSPFVRIVRAVAFLKGLSDRIELANRPEDGIQQVNPLNKVPTLVADDGEILIESRLIAQYLDGIGSGDPLYPADPAARRAVLQREAVVLGVLDAVVLRRMETRRTDSEISEWWDGRQRDKIAHGLDLIESRIGDYTDEATIVPVELGSMLGFMARALPDFDWRPGRPKLAAWWDTYSKSPVMAKTDVA